MDSKGSTNDILQGSIWKQLILFGVPVLIGNLLQQLYNTVDSVIVGRYVSNLALAAVGSTTSLCFLIVSFFQGIATGANVVVSQYIGAGETDNARKSISTAILLSLISGTILAIVFYGMTPYLLKWMLTPDDIFDLTEQYLKIYMISMPIIAIYNTGTAILRSMGDSKTPLYILVLSSIINVCLDLLFIRVFNMGVAGAAIATLIAQLISSILIVYILVRYTGEYRMKRSELHINKVLAKRIIKLGLPAAIQSSAVSFANVLFQSQVNIFGSIAVAGYSVGSRITSFCYMPSAAFGVATTTFVAQNFGARNYKRVKECVNVCMVLSIGMSLILSILAYVFRYPILEIFSSDLEVMEYGALMMKIVGLTCFLWAFPQIFGAVLTGMGKNLASMLIIMINMCAIRLVWIFIMLRIWNDIRVVYLGFPVSWLTASISIVAYYLYSTKKLYADL